jgi:hypothetical protein
MSAGKHNILVEKKVTFRKVFTLYSTYISEGNVGNVPIDLTSATVAAKIRKKVTDSSVVATFTCALMTDGTDGAFKIELSAAQTAALSGFDVGVYDVLVTFPSGDVVKYIEGTVVLDKTVT